MPRLPAFPSDCTVTVDGVPLPARAGEPLAAALIAAGRPLLSRSAKYHRPRGAFCLVGACGTCLVRAGGLPNQRACRLPCAPDLVIETQNAVPSVRHDLLGLLDAVYAHGMDHHHLMTWNALANRAAVAVARQLAGLGQLPGADAGPVPPGPPAQAEPWEALVVGAGPAGLAAAEALAEQGRRVLLADSEPVAGGRLRARLGLTGEPGLDWAAGVAARVRAAGGEVALGTAVLGFWIDAGAPLAALRGEGRGLRLVRPGRIVLCPGGHPTALAAVDGDRPGVHAARGLLAALAEHGVLPGRRIAVAGEGAEAQAAAARFAAAGVAVEAAPAVARVHGRARVRAVEVPGRGRVLCDAVAVALPPAPAVTLARLLGAAVEPGEDGTPAVRVDAEGRTSVPGLLAAGEVTGAVDPAAAAERGRRAGEAARG